MYSIFNVTEWNRRHTYEFFLGFDDPYVDATVDMDVTKLYKYCKERELGFSYATLWVALKMCNSIDNFRLRMVDGELRLYDLIHAGQTLAFEDGSYTHCFMEYHPDLDTFCKNSKAHALDRLNYPGEHDTRSSDWDVIHTSITRWFKFTSIKNPRMNRADHVPKLLIGKAEEQPDGRIIMPVSMSVHHALMDGYHLGLFFTGYQKLISEL